MNFTFEAKGASGYTSLFPASSLSKVPPCGTVFGIYTIQEYDVNFPYIADQWEITAEVEGICSQDIIVETKLTSTDTPARVSFNRVDSIGVYEDNKLTCRFIYDLPTASFNIHLVTMKKL